MLLWLKENDNKRIITRNRQNAALKNVDLKSYWNFRENLKIYALLRVRLTTNMVFTMIILEVFNKLINKNWEYLNITSKNYDKNRKHYLLQLRKKSFYLWWIILIFCFTYHLLNITIWLYYIRRLLIESSVIVIFYIIFLMRYAVIINY